MLFFPYYIGAGFLTGRRSGIASAVTTGAVTALTGHLVVFLTTVLYTLINGTWPAALTWLGIGVSLALAILFLGALGSLAVACGGSGGAVGGGPREQVRPAQLAPAVRTAALGCRGHCACPPSRIDEEGSMVFQECFAE
ncbi:hypothetical protein AB0J40_07205 [Amycolatopsis sp. NPDC049691]|uniref:hypothetical protein n=1 Tax=Amycolatopsis sp. NPDC049691 TaxID=3155155 RepID=UPI003424083E